MQPDPDLMVESPYPGVRGVRTHYLAIEEAYGTRQLLHFDGSQEGKRFNRQRIESLVRYGRKIKEYQVAFHQNPLTLSKSDTRPVWEAVQEMHRTNRTGFLPLCIEKTMKLQGLEDKDDYPLQRYCPEEGLILAPGFQRWIAPRHPDDEGRWERRDCMSPELLLAAEIMSNGAEPSLPDYYNPRRTHPLFGFQINRSMDFLDLSTLTGKVYSRKETFHRRIRMDRIRNDRGHLLPPPTPTNRNAHIWEIEMTCQVQEYVHYPPEADDIILLPVLVFEANMIQRETDCGRSPVQLQKYRELQFENNFNRRYPLDPEPLRADMELLEWEDNDQVVLLW